MTARERIVAVLNEHLAAVWNVDIESLADTVEQAAAPTPLIDERGDAVDERREIVHAPEGDFLQVWESETVPARGTTFRVLHDEWVAQPGEMPVRTIKAYEAVA